MHPRTFQLEDDIDLLTGKKLIVVAGLGSSLPDEQTGLLSRIVPTKFSQHVSDPGHCLCGPQCDGTAASRLTNSYSNSQLPDTQRVEIHTETLKIITPSPTLQDLLPATQRASTSPHLTQALLKDTSLTNRHPSQASIEDVSDFRRNPAANFNLLHTEKETDVSGKSRLYLYASDSRLPDTQREDEQIIESINRYPPNLGAPLPENKPKLDSCLPDTQRHFEGIGCWVTQEDRSLESQLSTTNSHVKSFSTTLHIGIGEEFYTSNQKPDCTPSISPLTTISLSRNCSSLKRYSSIPINCNTKTTSTVDPSPVPQKPPINKISIRERKRIVISAGRHPSLTSAMRLWIKNSHALLDPFREDDDCWLHPSPPRAHVSLTGILRPHGKLQKTFIWQDLQGRHSLVLNYGIVSKLIYHDMTKQQQDGFINKQWHLSHLCGNWVCINSKHTTVEPGNVNISRNNCFSHRSGCPHNPPCMKEKKVALGADGRPVDHNASVVASHEIQADAWDDWSAMSMDDDDPSIQDEDEEISL